MDLLNPPDLAIISQQVRLALAEDIGSGDLTTMLIADDVSATANIICREPLVVCGILWVEEVLRQLNQMPASLKCRTLGSVEVPPNNKQMHVIWQVKDGMSIPASTTLCTIFGNARILLTAERTILNFLQTLSATATLTQQYLQAVVGAKVIIVDTRKTIPGLRAAQKYAVRCGGGNNQRLGLFDAILIKENHIQAAGSIAKVLAAARRNFPNVAIQIEVETIDELQQALAAGATNIMLDDFNLSDLKTAVDMTQGRAILEASGGVTLHTVRAIADTGVDRISIGSLTKNIHAPDLSMRITNY